MLGVFKKGDIFFLNDEGKILFQHIGGENGIVMSDPYKLYETDLESETRVIEFYGFYLLIRGKLFKEIPEKFLLRVTTHEKNIE